MFPEILDGAKVIYYTPENDYGSVYYSNGEIADYIKYLAICQYSGDCEIYYLFSCNKNYEVLNDSVWDSTKECMRVSNSCLGGNIVWIKV